MTIQLNATVNGKIATITVVGRFDFKGYREFRVAAEEVLKAEGVAEINLDMKKAEHLDSSALGMLLSLRDNANRANRLVLLSNCNGAVQQVLETANFYKLFKIN